MVKYNAVFFDMDGTNIKALQYLCSKNIMIGIATGRSTSNVFRFLSQLNLAQPFIPMVLYNGAYGFKYFNDNGNFSHDNREVVFEKLVSEDLTKKVISFITKHGDCAQYYLGLTGEVLACPTSPEHAPLVKAYADMVGNTQTIISNFDDPRVQASLPAKVLALTHHADEHLQYAYDELGVNEFTIIRGSPDPPFFLEFLPKNVCKGEGVIYMCEKLGLDINQVVAFGDGANDQEMLHLAGLGIAMKNGQDAAKNAAKLVTKYTNQEDGVAKQLLEMIEEGLFF